MRCCSRPLLGEGPGVKLLLSRARRLAAPILNLTSLIVVSRSTRKVGGYVVAVRVVSDERLKKWRRKPRGRGSADENKKLLLFSD